MASVKDATGDIIGSTYPEARLENPLTPGALKCLTGLKANIKLSLNWPASRKSSITMVIFLGLQDGPSTSVCCGARETYIDTHTGRMPPQTKQCVPFSQADHFLQGSSAHKNMGHTGEPVLRDA